MFKGISTQQLFYRGKQLFSISLFAAYTLPATSTVAAQVAKLNNWRFYPDAGKLEINLSVGKTPNYFYLSEPPRIVVDIPDTKLGNIPTQQNYAGAVQRIRVSQLNANVTRIVLDLATGIFVDPNQVKLQPISQQNPTRWVLLPFIGGSRQLSNTNNSSSNPLPTQYNYLQLPNTLSPTITSPQQPFVTVPPLNSSNAVQIQNSPPSPTNFPTPTISTQPKNPPITTNPVVIEFGQPLPK
ncbi:AMIN domain-containing protein [Anabaena minutissima FACHB-250]|nr:AMIN domain-containing protein [Anabaena minutissima FACHB-250]